MIARALIGVWLVGACAARPVAQPKSPPDVVTIMREMAETYRTATSYRDRGAITTVFATVKGPQRKPARTFETAFVRPQQFRFVFHDDLDRDFVIWSDGARTYRRLPSAMQGAVEDGNQLGRSIASAVGVTEGTSHAIPRLLLPEVVGGPAFTELEGPRLVGLEVLDGHPCWRVTGSRRGVSTVLWIDQATHLIRQTFERATLVGTESMGPRGGLVVAEETVTYVPVANQPIDPVALRGPDLSKVAAAPATPSWVGVRLDQDGATRVRVVLVIPNSPADRGGVKANDEIVSIDGARVLRNAQFISHVRKVRLGATVTVVVARDGVEHRLELTPEPTPEMTALTRRGLLDRPAPAFAATLVAGPHPATLAAHTGHVVIVDFWATWCGPCKLTIPQLNAWHKQYASAGLRIIGVSGETTDEIRQYGVTNKLEYTVARDEGERISRDYLVPAIPMLVVIDKQGVVRGVGVGSGDLAAIEALVVRLLK